MTEGYSGDELCARCGGHAFYYLRMRHKCFTFIGVDAMGECVMLTDTGCKLTFGDRPKGGRMLEACADGRCVQHYTQGMMIGDWDPYQKLLGNIWRDWHECLERESVFDRCEEEYMQFQSYFSWVRNTHLLRIP